MAIFTAAEIVEQKTAWKKALAAVSTGQTYTVGKRQFTRADLPEIRRTLEWLDEQASLTAAAAAGPLIVQGRVRR